MFGRLFRQSRPDIFSSRAFFFKAAPTFNPRPSASFRSFWTSSRVYQKYRYARFNDPHPHVSGSQGSYFQSWWNRFTPVQRLLIAGVGGGAPVFYITHLETVEPTGRRRFIFMSRSIEEALGKTVHPTTTSLTTGIRANNARIQGSSSPLIPSRHKNVRKSGPTSRSSNRYGRCRLESQRH
jgi:hypothetical protein